MGSEKREQAHRPTKSLDIGPCWYTRISAQQPTWAAHRQCYAAVINGTLALVFDPLDHLVDYSP